MNYRFISQCTICWMEKNHSMWIHFVSSLTRFSGFLSHHSKSFAIFRVFCVPLLLLKKWFLNVDGRARTKIVRSDGKLSMNGNNRCGLPSGIRVLPSIYPQGWIPNVNQNRQKRKKHLSVQFFNLSLLNIHSHSFVFQVTSVICITPIILCTNNGNFTFFFICNFLFSILSN